MRKIKDLNFFCFLKSKGYETQILGCMTKVNIDEDNLVKENLEYQLLIPFLESKREVTKLLTTNGCFKK